MGGGVASRCLNLLILIIIIVYYCISGLGSSTVDQVLKYTKYIPSTSTGQVLIFFKKYLSTSSTFISSTSTHIKIYSKVRVDIQSRVNIGWKKIKGLSPNHVCSYSVQSRFWVDKLKVFSKNHVFVQKSR